MKNKEIQKQYGNTAKNTRSDCCTPPDHNALKFGYSNEDICCAPKDSNMGLSCGNPKSIAELKPGEVVLDLGCGGGFDCFLAAKQVGETGQVIGIDITPEMIETAQSNALKAGTSNVEFRLGDIAQLPVEDSSIDVVISNCVVNLSDNKTKVFEEIRRVLTNVGELMINC